MKRWRTIVKPTRDDVTAVTVGFESHYRQTVADLLALDKSKTESDTIEYEADRLYSLGRIDPERHAATIVVYARRARFGNRDAFDTLTALIGIYTTIADPYMPKSKALAAFHEAVQQGTVSQPPRPRARPQTRLAHVLRARAVLYARIAFDLSKTAAIRRVAKDTGAGFATVRNSNDIARRSALSPTD